MSVFVTIVGATGLSNSEIDISGRKATGAILFASDTDAYIHLKLGKEIRRTRIINDSDTPIWNQTLELSLPPSNDPSILKITILDYGEVKDDVLGRVTLNLETFVTDLKTKKNLKDQEEKSNTNIITSPHRLKVTREGIHNGWLELIISDSNTIKAENISNSFFNARQPTETFLERFERNERNTLEKQKLEIAETKDRENDFLERERQWILDQNSKSTDKSRSRFSWYEKQFGHLIKIVVRGGPIGARFEVTPWGKGLRLDAFVNVSGIPSQLMRNRCLGGSLLDDTMNEMTEGMFLKQIDEVDVASLASLSVVHLLDKRRENDKLMIFSTLPGPWAYISQRIVMLQAVVRGVRARAAWDEWDDILFQEAIMKERVSDPTDYNNTDKINRTLMSLHTSMPLPPGFLRIYNNIRLENIQIIETAAIEIQRFQRGRGVRERMKRRQIQKRTEWENYKKDECLKNEGRTLQNKNQEFDIKDIEHIQEIDLKNKAAIKMQAICRGYARRRYYKNMKYEKYSAVSKIQKVYRGHNGRQKYNNIKYEKYSAVSKIQKIYRGYNGRQKYNNIKYQMYHAACKIQKMYRNDENRDFRNNKRRIENRQKAATELQRHWRGCQGRVIGKTVALTQNPTDAYIVQQYRDMIQAKALVQKHSSRLAKLNSSMANHLKNPIVKSGALHCIVHSAKNLPNLDQSLRNRGDLSDPYCKLELGRGKKIQRFVTDVIQNELNPKWEKSFVLNNNPLREKDTLQVTVLDSDTLRDEVIGTCTISVTDIILFPRRNESAIKLQAFVRGNAGRAKARDKRLKISTAKTSGFLDFKYNRTDEEEIEAALRTKRFRAKTKIALKLQARTRGALGRLIVSDMRAPKLKNISGEVEVVVLNATNLPRADRNSSDPFVKLSCVAIDGTKQIHKTSIKKKQYKKPSWNESFTFYFKSWEECKSASIDVVVYDWDLIGSNDLMGVAAITNLGERHGALIRQDGIDDTTPIAAISEERTLTLTNETKGKDRKKKTGGDINFRITVRGFPTSESIERHRTDTLNQQLARTAAAQLAARKIKQSIFEDNQAKASAELLAATLSGKYGTGTVTVEVMSARDLPRADRRSSDPFVELSCTTFTGTVQKYKTSTKKKDLFPVWKEAFTFSFLSWEECKSASIDVVVYDWDLIGSNDLMGVAAITNLGERHGALIRPDGIDDTTPIAAISEERTLTLTNETKGKDRKKKTGGDITFRITVQGFSTNKTSSNNQREEDIGVRRITQRLWIPLKPGKKANKVIKKSQLKEEKLIKKMGSEVENKKDFCPAIDLELWVEGKSVEEVSRDINKDIEAAEDAIEMHTKNLIAFREKHELVLDNRQRSIENSRNNVIKLLRKNRDAAQKKVSRCCSMAALQSARAVVAAKDAVHIIASTVANELYGKRGRTVIIRSIFHDDTFSLLRVGVKFNGDYVITLTDVARCKTHKCVVKYETTNHLLHITSSRGLSLLPEEDEDELWIPPYNPLIVESHPQMRKKYSQLKDMVDTGDISISTFNDLLSQLRKKVQKKIFALNSKRNDESSVARDRERLRAELIIEMAVRCRPGKLLARSAIVRFDGTCANTNIISGRSSLNVGKLFLASSRFETLLGSIRISLTDIRDGEFLRRSPEQLETAFAQPMLKPKTEDVEKERDISTTNDIEKENDKYDPGTVKISILSANDLPIDNIENDCNTDKSLEFAQKIELEVVCKKSSEKYKTKEIRLCCNPEWNNETFIFHFDSLSVAKDSNVTIGLYQWNQKGLRNLIGISKVYNIGNVNDEIGGCKKTMRICNLSDVYVEDASKGELHINVALDGFYAERGVSKVLSISDATKDLAISAVSAAQRLKNSIIYSRTTEETSDVLNLQKTLDDENSIVCNTGTGTVTVEVISARNLPRADRNSSDPFVQLSYTTTTGKIQKYKTSTKKKNLFPVWKEVFTFSFLSWEECKSATIDINVYDWDLIGSNDLMGVAVINNLGQRNGTIIRPDGYDSNVAITGELEFRELSLENKTTRKDKKKGGGALRISLRVQGFQCSHNSIDTTQSDAKDIASQQINETTKSKNNDEENPITYDELIAAGVLSPELSFVKKRQTEIQVDKTETKSTKSMDSKYSHIKSSGTITFQVISAVDIPRVRKDVLHLFVKVIYDEQTYETSCVSIAEKNIDPVWNESFTIPCKSYSFLDQSGVVLELWHSDPNGDCDVLICRTTCDDLHFCKGKALRPLYHSNDILKYIYPIEEEFGDIIEERLLTLKPNTDADDGIVNLNDEGVLCVRFSLHGFPKNKEVPNIIAEKLRISARKDIEQEQRNADEDAIRDHKAALILHETLEKSKIKLHADRWKKATSNRYYAKERIDRNECSVVVSVFDIGALLVAWSFLKPFEVARRNITLLTENELGCGIEYFGIQEKLQQLQWQTQSRLRFERPGKIPNDWGEWLSLELMSAVSIIPDGGGIGGYYWSIDDWLMGEFNFEISNGRRWGWGHTAFEIETNGKIDENETGPIYLLPSRKDMKPRKDRARPGTANVGGYMTWEQHSSVMDARHSILTKFGSKPISFEHNGIKLRPRSPKCKPWDAFINSPNPSKKHLPPIDETKLPPFVNRLYGKAKSDLKIAELLKKQKSRESARQELLESTRGARRRKATASLNRLYGEKEVLTSERAKKNIENMKFLIRQKQIDEKSEYESWQPKNRIFGRAYYPESNSMKKLENIKQALHGIAKKSKKNKNYNIKSVPVTSNASQNIVNKMKRALKRAHIDPKLLELEADKKQLLIMRENTLNELKQCIHNRMECESNKKKSQKESNKDKSQKESNKKRSQKENNFVNKINSMNKKIIEMQHRIQRINRELARVDLKMKIRKEKLNVFSRIVVSK